MNGEGTNSILQYDGHVGLVTGIVGNAALVEFRRSDACGHCNACMDLEGGESAMQPELVELVGKAEL